MKNTIYIFLALMMLSCSSSRQSTGDDRFRRAAMVEVSQQQLDLEAMMVSAKMQQEVGNIQEAMQAYQDILSKSPGYGPACYEISGMLMSAYNLDQALDYARQAVKRSPKNTWYLMRLAEIYRMRQDGKPLIETWKSIVKLNPTNLNYYYELSDAYLLNNQIPEAVEVLDQVERMVGVTEMVSLQKQRLWDAYGKKDKALRELERLADAQPQSTKYNAILAQHHMTEHNYAKAKEYYDRILEAAPNDEYIHLSLATYYKETNQPEKAFEEMRQGLSHPGLDINSKLSMLVNFYNEGFYAEQSKYTYPLFDLIMQQATDKREYAALYGEVLMRQNKYPEAAEQLKLAIEVDSSQYFIWENLLISLVQINDNATTAHYAARAQKLFPLHILPHYLSALCAFEGQSFNEAEAHLRQCEKIGFSKGYLEAEVYALLANVLFELGKYEEMASSYDHYLTLRPNDNGIKNNYAYFLALIGDRLNDALRMAKEAVDAEPNNGTFVDTYAWVLYQMGRKREALVQIEKAVQLMPDRQSIIKHYEQIRNDQ